MKTLAFFLIVLSFSVFGQSPEGKCEAVWYQVSAFSTPNDSFPYQVLEGRGGITWPRCLEGNSTNQF